MSAKVRIGIAPEFADELLADGSASRPLRKRGPVEVLTFVVDSVNTGSAVVSVAAGAAVARRIALAMLRKRRPADPELITITARNRAGVESSIAVNRTDLNAPDQLLDFVLAILSTDPP